MSSEGTISVLCVDDEPDLASLVARFLTEDEPDITAEAITSGTEAIEQLDEDIPDCIVCDYDMPGMDGLEVLSAVRDRAPDIPFILFTGQGNEDVASDAVQAGVTDYIPKSTGTDQYELLANRIRNAVERQRAQRSMREVFNAATDAIIVHNPESGAIVDVNDAAKQLWSTDQEKLIGATPADLCLEDGVSERAWLPDEPVERGPRDWRCVRDDGDPFWVEIRIRPATIDGEDRLLAIGRDITNRKAREEQLSTLLAGAEAMMEARDFATLGGVITETMTETLDFDGAHLYLRDDETDRFEQISVAGELSEDIDAAAVESHAGNLFATDGGTQLGVGEPVRWDGLWTWSMVDGCVLIADRKADEGDDFTRDLVDLHLAVSRAAVIRSLQERRLEEQHDALEALNHMNEVIRDINETLVKVSTRDEIEQLVCKQLAAASPFVSAWIGEQDFTAREISVRVAVGRGADSLREIVIPTEEGATDALSKRIASVIDGFEVLMIEDMSEESLGEERAGLAAEHGYESLTIVPITYQNALYDLLAIYAEDPHPLGGDQQAVLKELGETIGYAMHTAERSRALLSDTRVELEYQIRDDTSLVYGLSDALETEVELERIFFRSDDSARLFLNVTDTNVAAIREAVTELHEGEVEVREISHRGDGNVVEVSIDNVGMMRHLSEAAASIRSATAEDGQGRLVIEIPNTVSVRTLTENLERVFDDISLLARRQRDAEDDDYSVLDDSADIGLTDRQHEVLLTAYHAGFFAWPRESTGEEIAELLDISQPTFHEHLRTGERKLLDLLFEHRRSVYS